MMTQQTKNSTIRTTTPPRLVVGCVVFFVCMTHFIVPTLCWTSSLSSSHRSSLSNRNSFINKISNHDGISRHNNPTTQLFMVEESTTSNNNNKKMNKFNVVLEPTKHNVDAFDSFKVGSAKVHRYVREDSGTTVMDNGDSDDSAEYVMWYHGRSVALHEQQSGGSSSSTENTKNPGLPPLSTGRIGRATSRNGLVWKKQTLASVSEDVQDVCLGLNQESWWSFDTTHVGLGSVLLPMSTPAVMTDGGVYLLYFMGGNGEDTLIQEYTTTSMGDDEKKVRGMKLKIGVALSQDGITFGRVEGDDPSGAIIAPSMISTTPSSSQQQQQQSSSTSESKMDEELYCGWPEVIVNIDTSPNEAFLMFYSTMLQSTKEKCIAYATSSDGFRWYKQGVCLQPSSSQEPMDADDMDDFGGCARCSVIKDAEYKNGIWKELNSYTMYYEGISKLDNKHRIMKATSNTGKEWKKMGLALDVGRSDNDTMDWDCQGVGSPHIIRLDDGTCRMYYTGQGLDGSTAIGVAKIDDMNQSGMWVREQATISLLI